MPNKTRNAPKRRKSRPAPTGKRGGGVTVPNPEAQAAGDNQTTEASPATLRINITRLGKHARFRIVHNETKQIIVTSSIYPTPSEAREALIKMIWSLQRDDFETFDHT